MKNLADVLKFLGSICPASASKNIVNTPFGDRPLSNYDLEFLEDSLSRALGRVRQARRPRKPKFPKLTQAEKELILAGKPKPEVSGGNL